MAPRLQFRPIDMEKDLATAARFRADAIAISFGDREPFVAEQYLEWLRKRVAEEPDSCLHAWLNGAIVGQLEMNARESYVYLFYLVPELRGQGLAKDIDDYATQFLRAKGCASASLSVSPTNVSALRFYERTGWKDTGVRRGEPVVHVLRKSL